MTLLSKKARVVGAVLASMVGAREPRVAALGESLPGN